MRALVRLLIHTHCDHGYFGDENAPKNVRKIGGNVDIEGRAPFGGLI